MTANPNANRAICEQRGFALACSSDAQERTDADMADDATDPLATRMDLRHLRRDTRTALELAIIELAPSQLIDRLAVVTGLLEALAELPPNSPPAIALGPPTADRARVALEIWRDWSAQRKKLA